MKPITRSLFSLLSRTLVFYSLVVSFIFLLGIVWLYQWRMQEQRSDAARSINLLLQVSLENAMLKRDIPGLEDIIARFSQQEGIDSLAILNPEGEVRFASRRELVGRRFDLKAGTLCANCRDGATRLIETSELLPRGLVSDEPVLRSVKAVANREACLQCHGDKSQKPINGLLVVDHAARDLRTNALFSALALAGSGLTVVLALVAGIYAALRRHVLKPIAELEQASQALAQGQYATRVPAEGGTELAALGHSFNAMAERLQDSMAELRSRERFVQGLMEALPDGVRVIDADFRVIQANAAFHRIHGLKPGTAIGQLCHATSHSSPEPCIPTLATCPLVALRKSDGPIKFFAIHKRADGRDLSVEVHAARVSAEPGTGRDYVVEVVRDLDAAVQVSHEQRLSELGQLATGIAHEIRNPLSSVSILLHEAENHPESATAMDRATLVRLIGHEVDRCLAITESLLKLGEPPAREPQLVEINEIIADMLTLLRFQAEQTGVSIITSLEPHLRILAADNDLRIVLINLIQNAFHAMPDGGVLTITGARSPAGKILLRMSDTGIGIAPEDLRSIFLPFWSRRADGIQGTGLGLSICRSIVIAAKGDILVSSLQGQGTTFTVELPDADCRTGLPNAS